MPHWSDRIDTSSYGQSTRDFAGMRIQPSVFFPTALIAVLVILGTFVWPEGSAQLFNGLRQGVIARFDGFMMAAGDLLLLFCLGLAVSPLGKLRIGGREARPDYSLPAWFSMLFGAGMGVGLVFYGVAEPMAHFTSALGPEAATAAPLGGAPGDVARARDLAMAATLFDWSLHPWAMYAVVGLGLAVFSYDFHMPLSMRSVFYPLFGRRVWGRTGDAIDILAVFATLFGLATSLGLGAEQAMAGITWLYGIPNQPLYVVGLIAVMAFVTCASVAGGIDRGTALRRSLRVDQHGARAAGLARTRPGEQAAGGGARRSAGAGPRRRARCHPGRPPGLSARGLRRCLGLRALAACGW